MEGILQRTTTQDAAGALQAPYCSAMAPASAGVIEELDRKIAEGERGIHEHVQCVITMLRQGEDTAAAENRVRHLREGLARVYDERRRMVRQLYETHLVIRLPHKGESRIGTA
jgi:triphosphoribosyl-dephospho-CoA synthetase